MEQAFTAQNRGLLTMRGRLVLGHHPRLVLGGEATPGRPWRRIDRPRPVLLGRLLVAAHVRISSHALQANPDRRGVSQQPDREGPGVLLYATTVRTSTTPPVVQATRRDLFPLSPGEAVLPASAQGSDLATLLGKTITVDITRMVASGQG